MAKLGASIFVVLALFAIVSAEQFQRINFDQGRLRLRTLDTTSSLKSVDFINYSENYLNTTAVNVNFGTEYNTKAEIDTTKTSTEMMILLSGSSTAFCTSCSAFKSFVCPANDCGANTAISLQTAHPFYYLSKANPFMFNVTIGADATSWQLKSPALLFTSSGENQGLVSWPGSGASYYYPQNHSTYGFIGMGVDGDSVKNFQGDHPLFSIVSNGSGSGQLIFGKDTTKYDSTKLSQAITTDTNWTMTIKNITAGLDQVVLSNYKHKLIFDLNYPGLGLPSYYYSDVLNKLINKYGVKSNTTGGNYQYPYVYAGDVANLGSIIFELSNGQNLTIPPQAYTRKLEDGYYSILLQSVSSISTNVYSQGSSETTYFGVIGWSVMSNFYTVFEKTATADPTITLYPTYSGAPSANGNNNTTTTTTSSWKTILIIIIVVLVALVVISVAAKKKNNLTKSDLGVELRAARV